jgi:hypothetical protein
MDVLRFQHDAIHAMLHGSCWLCGSFKTSSSCCYEDFNFVKVLDSLPLVVVCKPSLGFRMTNHSLPSRLGRSEAGPGPLARFHRHLFYARTPLCVWGKQLNVGFPRTPFDDEQLLQDLQSRLMLLPRFSDTIYFINKAKRDWARGSHCHQVGNQGSQA